jgi:hypothetical protein
MSTHWSKIREHLTRSFERDHASHWAHLSRFTNVLIILNISMFFLTELVTKQSYFYTYYSLLFLGLVYVGLLLPLGLANHLWYYIAFLMLEGVGIYFLIASAWYWVVTNRVPS